MKKFSITLSTISTSTICRIGGSIFCSNFNGRNYIDTGCGFY